jgi:hypothetical protein
MESAVLYIGINTPPAATKALTVMNPNPGAHEVHPRSNGRRVLMCYWKQWRHAHTKVRRPPALGVSRSGDLHSHQPQQLLALVEDAGDPDRNDQQVAG